MKHNICLVLSLVLLASCVKVKKKEDAQPAAEPPVVTVAAESADTAKKVEAYKTLDFNYVNQQIEFQIPEIWPQDLIVETLVQGTNNKIQIHLEETKIWKTPAPTQDKITYRFYSRLDNQENLLGQMSVIPILNLELKDSFNLAQKYKLDSTVKKILIQNLVLEKEGRLLFEDYSGDVKIENLVANGGYIQTFAQGQRAANGVKGRSGGQIKLNILNGSGEANIYMLGEDGGHGINGAPADESMRGARGAHGNMARIDGISCSMICFTCGAPGTSAQDGFKGAKGRPGGDGQVGGDSGLVKISLIGGDLKINFYSRSGQRGLKGIGGSGGAGGPPGVTGNGDAIDYFILIEKLDPDLAVKRSDELKGRMLTSPCPAPLPAHQGPAGDVGDSGQDGTDGLALSSEIFIQGKKSQFNNQ